MHSVLNVLGEKLYNLCNLYEARVPQGMCNAVSAFKVPQATKADNKGDVFMVIVNSTEEVLLEVKEDVE
jgi:hypothetical protein